MCDARQLVGRHACSRRVPRRQQDLDARREYPRSATTKSGIGHRARDDRSRRLDLTAGEAKQGEPWLRVAPVTACLAIRFLGRRELATQAMQFADLVER